MVGRTRRLFQGIVSGNPAATNTFTVSVATTIRGIWLNNRSAGSVEFNFAVVPKNTAKSVEHELLSAMEVVGKTPAIDGDVLNLESGDTVHLWCNTASVLNCYISGMEME
ncbi:hypothetical protein [Brevibacillus centrosporus]|uniref:hypothetical protein n=1 Tax=Brevibacillus centrosporus TaxID=54910 RepID=UPI003811EF86